MCLELNKKSKLKIATKNIVVYKCLKIDKDINLYTSPYIHNIYEKYNIYTSKIKINTYLHSYYLYGFINIGLHSCLTRKAADYHKYNQNYIVVKMIIPKGAYYIKGNFNEIVSDILIW